MRERLGIEAGSIFAIMAPQGSGMIVLRKVDDKSLQADLRVLLEVEKAWKEIERGRVRRATRKGFLEELRTW
jgi:bifunctional DNA-binding transcriptional regulator/antitoxin component of YhaV-PrlF toxin-antitoxin module